MNLEKIERWAKERKRVRIKLNKTRILVAEERERAKHPGYGKFTDGTPYKTLLGTIEHELSVLEQREQRLTTSLVKEVS
jgi:hypothetical protein